MLQSYPDPLAPGSALRYREGDRVEKINDGCPFYGADATWIRDYDFALTADLVRKAAAVTHTEYLDLTRLFDNHEVCSNHNGLVTSTSPPSPRTTEWARFFSIQHTAAQAIPSGPSSVPLMNSKDDGLGEILHPGYFGQLALGACLRATYAALAGDHACTSPSSGADAAQLTTKPFPGACSVPKVRGLTLAAARRALHRARCAIGQIVGPHGTARRLVVVWQTPAGTHLTPGATVKLRVANPHPRHRRHRS